jgi:peptidoglycan/LPS O-acetylase OafA/YrhL
MKRYSVLDGMRGIAAVFVMFYHVWVYHDAPLLAPHGYLAVDFFLMLSGFIIAATYERKLHSDLAVTDFFVRRLIRLYPVALIGILVGCAKLGLQFIVSPSKSEPIPIIVLACSLNLFLLPFLSTTHFNVLFPANGVMWSLFGEIFVNLVWAILTALLRPGLWLLIIITAILGVILCQQMVVHGLADLGWQPQHFIGSCARIGFPIFLGAVFCRLETQIARLKSNPVIAIVVLIVDLGMPLQMEAWDFLSVFFLLPLALTLGISCGRDFESAINHFLGAISYPLYAVHYPIFFLLAGFQHSLMPQISLWIVIPFGFAAAILLAQMLASFYEPLARKRLTDMRTRTRAQ